MREVTWSSPLLGLRELSLELAQFLRAIYPHMASDEQEAVDRAVLSLPEFDVGVEDVAEEHRSQLRRGSRRAMFLGSIGAQARSLACRESIARLQLLLSPASLPVDHTMLVRRDLTDGGTLPAVANPPADDHLAALTSAVAARASAWQNVDVVSADDLERAEMDLAALEAALASESVSSGGLRRHAFTALSDACSHAACAPALRDRPRLLGVVVSVLLRAEGDPAPRGGDSAEAQYASAPSWSSPAPRIDAAVSLPVLLGRTDCDGRQELVRAAVRRLAFDPSPAVRGQLTRRLPLALPVEAILVRSLASELIETERQHDVVLQCLQCVGQGVVRTENGDGLDLVRRAWDRAPTLLGKDAAGEVRSACAGICMGRHLVVGDGVGQDIVDLVANDPGKFHVEASGLAGDLREEIAQLDGMDATLARVGRRQRAIVYFARLCRAASNQFREWVARPSGERDADVGRNLVRLLDHLAYQVLFASGEHGSTAPTDRAGPLVVELTQSIESIADAGLVPASHTLLKTLRFLRPSNPAAVLCMASRTVVRARDSGLGFEQLAADEAVAIVETVLVEHREVLRGSSASARRSRTDLIAMLDVFVEGAWPHALALTSRLHEAFV
jgi:hypothetical protein